MSVANPTAVELKQSRAAVVAQGRAIVDKAAAENRDMSADENTQFTAAIADADKLLEKVRSAEAREWVEAQEADQRASSGRRTAPATPGANGRTEVTAHDYAESMRAWALAGTDRSIVDADTLHRAAGAGIRITAPTISLRALSKGTATAGGHAVPVDMAGGLIEKLAFFNPIRQLCQKLSTDTGADLDYPRVNDTANSATIVGEAGTINTNADPSLDKVTMKAWKYATTIVLVSIELLADMNVNVPQLLARLLAKRMSRGQRAHFVTGNGTTQPEGITTNATVAANLVANALTVDKLVDLIYSVDRDYRDGARFLIHDETVAGIVKLKDTAGQYLWQPSIQAGESDTIRGYGVDVSNDMTPIGTPGDNLPLVAFGNYGENYLVRDVAGSLQMTRLNELYAATGQVGFNLLMRTDGRPIAHTGWVKLLNTTDS